MDKQILIIESTKVKKNQNPIELLRKSALKLFERDFQTKSTFQLDGGKARNNIPTLLVPDAAEATSVQLLLMRLLLAIPSGSKIPKPAETVASTS